MQRIDLFQLKGFRKILRMKTTFITRENTNNRVFEKANELMQTENQTKR